MYICIYTYSLLLTSTFFKLHYDLYNYVKPRIIYIYIYIYIQTTKSVFQNSHCFHQLTHSLIPNIDFICF